MPNNDALQQHAAHIRASGVLGRPSALTRLFDYLLERTLAGETPKEIEIAYKVFGKNSGFDVAQDAVVRVYVHKLRRRLEEYYARLEDRSAARLTIPKGEYRLIVEEPSVHAARSAVSIDRPRAARWTFVAVVAVLAGAIGSLLTYVAMRPDQRADQLAELRASPLWAPLFSDDLPITIVIGDYYLMGETDESGSIRRLVREFSVNSTKDFLQQVEMRPQAMERYRNLNFSYLPTSTAFALNEIVPVLATTKPVRVALMSDLDGAVLATSHIVYVGLLSGLGILTEPTLHASRISVGVTYDELVDRDSDAIYRSTAGDASEERSVDYAFVSAFPGPGKNRVVILAGARDTAVAQLAKTLTMPEALSGIVAKAGEAESFESLFEVYGVARTGMNAKPLFVSPLDVTRIWDMEQ